MAYGLSGFSQAPTQTPIGNPRFESVIKAELALMAWRHGKVYGGHQGMTNIAHCIANRHKKGWGPWLSILQSVPKYAATLDSLTDMPESWDRNFLQLLSAIDGIVDGTARDTVNGGLFWCDLNNITSEWFLEQIARSPNYMRVADMGSLVFFSPRG
jgi:hypothetical protein